jgi:hypothetical protein
VTLLGSRGRRLASLACLSLCAGLIVIPAFLFAATFGARADNGPVVIRIKMAGDEIEFSYRGKKLTDSKLDQLCAMGRQRKVAIEFKRDKMTRDNALAAILKEAQCLGATRTSFTGIGRYPEPKSALHRHARPQHRGATPR